LGVRAVRLFVAVCAVAAGCSSGAPTPPTDDASDGSRDAPAADLAPDVPARVDAKRETAPVASVDAGPLDTVLSAFCDLASQSISASGTISGVLAGGSRNAIANCAPTTPTPGPDAFYTLELDTFTVVDLRVDAPIDTIVAVRGGCEGAVVELGCGDRYTHVDDSVPDGADGGVAAANAHDAAGALTSRLRVGLPAGRYTVVVDAMSPGDGSAVPFTLTTTIATSTANGTCASAARIDANTVTHARLDLGGPPGAGCGGAATGALFYAFDVPSGQRFYATASATAGDRDWQPHLAALDSCATSSCLAQGSAVAGPNQKLIWVNNTADTRTVILEVSSDGPVTNAELDLVVGLAEVSSQCAAAPHVLDGETFTNLDLTSVPMSTNTCGGFPAPALYFLATVLPHQELDVTVPDVANSIPAVIGLRMSCDDACTDRGEPARALNTSDQAETVVVEVTSVSDGALFNLDFSLPPAPAFIAVTPTSPLVTTEAGGRATFEVVLASVPAAPVTIPVTSSRPDEGTPSPAALVFDATNWNQPQTVTVTGVDDQASDGAQKYTIATGPAHGADRSYVGLTGETLPLTNLDDEPGLVLDGADDVVTSEDGTTARFTIRLVTPPTTTVLVPVTSADPGEGTVSPSLLSFSPASWNVPQAVTVTGVDDGVTDGTKAYAIGLGPLASGDARYAGLEPAAIIAHNRDNDFSAGKANVNITGSFCRMTTTPSQYPIAVDAFGKLYAVVSCNGQLQLVTSPDGGATLSSPTQLPGPPNFDNVFAIAAGRAGAVSVAYETTDNALELLRSTDGGATWTARPIMPLAPGALRIAAARDTLVIAGANQVTQDVYSGTVVLRSENGGLSFLPPQLLDHSTSALGIRPDGGVSWLVDDRPVLFASTGANGAFEAVGPIGGPPGQCCYVFGSADVYGIYAGGVAVSGLAGATALGVFSGPNGGPIAAAVDAANVVTLFGNDSSSMNVLGTRFGTDFKATGVTIVAPQAGFAGAVALSYHATTSLTFNGTGTVDGSSETFTLSTWP
jgi:hypothetical protein